ncbi:MAG: NDP-sugar synthase, partial [Candidatus Bathyarchaeota archaeon]
VLDHCKRNGIKDIVLCINSSLKSHFYNALSNGEYLGVNIQYSIGPVSYGTAGRILNAKNLIQDDDVFVAYYGDMICDFSLNSMIKSHKQKASNDNRIATLAMSDSTPMAQGGGFEDDSSRITYFEEKPKISKISKFKINIGIGVFSPRILKYCSKKADLYKDIVPLLIKKGEVVCGYTVNEPFYDIGTFSSIDKILKTVSRRPSSLLVKK